MDLYRRHIKAFKAFHIRSLQSILGIRWWQKIPHTELFEKAGITPAEHLLLQRQLRWLRHVIRMPDNRLPRRLLYGKLTAGQRSVGRPKKRFIDHIKANLLKCNSKPSDLEVLASDRDIWRTVCDIHLRSFLNGWITTSLKNDVQPVTLLPQSRRQVHDVLSAEESVPPISDSEVTCGPTTRPATLSSSATSSLNSTDFSSSSSILNIWHKKDVMLSPEVVAFDDNKKINSCLDCLPILLSISVFTF